jgi:hypothetical protein
MVRPEARMAQDDNYGHHEVVHLSSVIASLWEGEILEHGAVQATPELKAEASAIFNKIANFYQLASKVSYEKFSV